LSLRTIEELLLKRGIALRGETVRLWRDSLGPVLAADIHLSRVSGLRDFR